MGRRPIPPPVSGFAENTSSTNNTPSPSAKTQDPLRELTAAFAKYKSSPEKADIETSETIKSLRKSEARIATLEATCERLEAEAEQTKISKAEGEELEAKCANLEAENERLRAYLDKVTQLSNDMHASSSTADSKLELSPIDSPVLRPASTPSPIWKKRKYCDQRVYVPSLGMPTPTPLHTPTPRPATPIGRKPRHSKPYWKYTRQLE